MADCHTLMTLQISSFFLVGGMPEIFDAKNKQEPTKRTHGNSKTNSKSNSLNPPHTIKNRDKINF